MFFSLIWMLIGTFVWIGEHTLSFYPLVPLPSSPTLILIIPLRYFSKALKCQMTLVICLSLRDQATEAAAAVVDAAPTHPPQSCGMHGDIPALSIWLEIVKRDLHQQEQCFSAHGMCLCVTLKTPVTCVPVTVHSNPSSRRAVAWTCQKYSHRVCQPVFTCHYDQCPCQ